VQIKGSRIAVSTPLRPMASPEKAPAVSFFRLLLLSRQRVRAVLSRYLLIAAALAVLISLLLGAPPSSNSGATVWRLSSHK
jgi:hypothetical protein